MGIKGLKAMNELIMLKRNGAGNRTLSISATFSLAKITKFCVQAQNISTLIQQNLQSQFFFFFFFFFFESPIKVSEILISLHTWRVTTVQ